MTLTELGREMLCALNEEQTPMIGVVVGAAIGFLLSLLRPLDRQRDRFRFLVWLLTGVFGAVVVRALFGGAC